MSEAPGLLTVVEGAEIKHARVSEKGTNFKLVTYGRQLQITRDSLINDDLDAFSRMPQAFGDWTDRLLLRQEVRSDISSERRVFYSISAT